MVENWLGPYCTLSVVMRVVVRVVAVVLLTTLLSCSVVLAREKPELTVGVLLRPNTENVHIDDGTNGTSTGGMLVPGIFEPVAKWTHGGKVLGCDFAVRTTSCAYIVSVSILHVLFRFFFTSLIIPVHCTNKLGRCRSQSWIQ